MVTSGYNEADTRAKRKLRIREPRQRCLRLLKKMGKEVNAALAKLRQLL